MPHATGQSIARGNRYPGKLTDIAGLRVGVAEDRVGMTGVTTVVCERLFRAGVDVRGGGPGTLNTDVLSPYTGTGCTDCIALAGGSALGLGCMGGCMQWLEEHDRGFDTGLKRIPMVNGAIIYDLGVGSPHARPTWQMGYDACASASGDVPQGRAGAGLAATVGKVLLDKSMEPGGQGTACIDLGDGIQVAALAVVNALGDVYDGESIIAGAHDEHGRHFGTVAAMLASEQANVFGKNTTISVIATHLNIDRGMVTKLAQVAHDGYAIAIRPVHTLADGDTVFGITTGAVDAPEALNRVLAAAAEAMRRAIVNAVMP